jgi:hypothetical protein
MERIDFAFVSEASKILAALGESRKNETVIGISAPILGNGIFLTSVEDIKPAGNDYTIVLKGYDITGYILERNKIRLTDVRAVCPFNSPFRNPYLKELTGEKFYEMG